MNEMPSPVSGRDLTDQRENLAVLQRASQLLIGGPVVDRLARSQVTGSPVELEAVAAARSRRQLESVAGPFHVSIVWAMYGESGRIQPGSEHPHGEDFLRMKVAQLRWLFAGLEPNKTWSIIACDDGCPDQPSSGEAMRAIVATEKYNNVDVIDLASIIASDRSISPAFDALTSTDESRKGGSILAAMAEALERHNSDRHEAETATAKKGPEPAHVICYTDADLSTNLAQVGSLVAPIVTDGAVAAFGQRYGLPGAIRVSAAGPLTEPESTGSKPDKLILLFRHYVRAMLIPSLAHVLDTQAGFKAFAAEAVRLVVAEMGSFNETFDVELAIRLAQRFGPEAVMVEPILFTEDYAATNFPSVDPGERHLAMIGQIVDIYDRFVAKVEPVTGEAADLLQLLRNLDLDRYVAIIEHLKRLDPGDHTLFDRRWPLQELTAIR